MKYIKKLKKYPNHKVCTLCNKKLLKINFRKNGKYLASRCTKCTVGAQRNQQLVSKYGITETEFEDMLKRQNYTCAICNQPQKSKNRAMCVDHCHNTGKVRELLCDLCNTALGKFQDDKKLLKAAILYLKKHGK